MKKTILIAILALAGITSVHAQEEDQTDSQKRLDNFTAEKRHEVSLDVISALVIPAFNPRYEYVLGRYSGVGVDLFITFNNEDISFEDYEKLSLTPYYRQYFFSKEDYGAKGFYGEGFLKFFTYDDFEYNDDFSSFENEKTYFETAIGVGIGWKWVSDSGFMIDLGLGLGRDLGFADNDDYDLDIRVRGGLNFGWRF
ncbi:MAG: DUF3575 domain-containing protein [Nonlabens sp.]